MKITVVTVHDSANFGSFLQGYALNRFLKERGHDVSFAITRDKKYVKGLYYSLRPAKWWLRCPIKAVGSIIGGIKKYRVFKKEQSVFKETDKISGADAVILGSDEIWNIKTKVFTNPLFYGESCKNAIAYGVSAGLATFDDFKAVPYLCTLIKKLSAPLVRDENTAVCVEKITGTRPCIVCDPTILVKKDIFEKPYSNAYLEKHPCLVLYVYEPEPQVIKLFKDFARKHGLKLVSVGFHYDWCDKSILCSPLEFCSVMEKAKYVITTTFHGSIFSALNHKQFVSVPLSGKTNDILSRLGLSHVVVSFDKLNLELLEQKLFKNKIDYNEVENKIKSMREFSQKLLEERIKEYENL